MLLDIYLVLSCFLQFLLTKFHIPMNILNVVLNGICNKDNSVTPFTSIHLLFVSSYYFVAEKCVGLRSTFVVRLWCNSKVIGLKNDSMGFSLTTNKGKSLNMMSSPFCNSV